MLETENYNRKQRERRTFPNVFPHRRIMSRLTIMIWWLAVALVVRGFRLSAVSRFGKSLGGPAASAVRGAPVRTVVSETVSGTGGGPKAAALLGYGAKAAGAVGAALSYSEYLKNRQQQMSDSRSRTAAFDSATISSALVASVAKARGGPNLSLEQLENKNVHALAHYTDERGANTQL